MFPFQSPESQLDDFLETCPHIGHISNCIETQDDDDLRVVLKRATCVVEMHREQYVDVRIVREVAGLPAEISRVYFDAIEPYVDAYLIGSMEPETLLENCLRVRNTMSSIFCEKGPNATRAYKMRLAFVKSAHTGLLASFDSKFTKLAAVQMSKQIN